jgi:hypothetical protein
MKKLLVGLAALPFLAGVAMAGQPVSLSDAQMDKVTAGLDVLFTFSGNAFTAVFTSPPGGVTPLPIAGAFLDTQFPSLDGVVAPGFPVVIGGVL